MSDGALILSIEDNPTNLKLARDIPTTPATRPSTPRTRRTGSRSPSISDLVLMDVQLPGMDGVRALGSLRFDPETCDIPVITLTAFAMKDDRERSLTAGFDRYVAKPLDIREFPRQVAAALAAAGTNA